MKIVILSIITISFFLDVILSILNYRYKDASVPVEVQDVYDQEAYNKWKKYYMENFRLSIISSTVSFVIIFILLIFNVFYHVFSYASDFTSNEHLQAIIIMGFYFLINYLLGIIFSHYRTFNIEERYCFNRTTHKTFIIDKIKSLILTTLIGGGIIYGLSTIYSSAGNMFYIYAWISVITFILLLNLFYIKLFIPIFNKLKPLEDGELKESINELAHKVGYEVKKISIMDASRRSTKLNAFFTGFGKFKHVVLFDTLIDKMTNDQILSVLAHEIGHSKKRHTLKNLFLSIITLSLFLLFLYICIKEDSISIAFGFKQANFGFGALIFILILTPLSVIINALTNPISRKFEYEADYYAAVNTSKESMIESLKVLARENFANLTPHPFYVKILYTHPPIADRIKAINNI